MNLITVGTNHNYSPIKFRERISFSKKALKDALGFLIDETGVDGAVIVSTCNRVEVYASCNCPERGIDKISDFLSTYHEIDKRVLAPYLYRHAGIEAFRHLAEVASGLDSQVLGETEILEQIRFFYKESMRMGFSDSFLEQLFNQALTIGRIVRLRTRISRGNASIGNLAITLVKSRVKDLKKKKALIIGMGEVSKGILQRLLKEGVDSILISNKTYDKALLFANSIGAVAVRFDRLKEELRQADIVISATSSPHTILKKEDLIDISKPILIIDLALPRDIDPRVKEISGVWLFDLDSLKSVTQENVAKRRIEAERARAIINEEVNKLWKDIIKSVPEPAPLH